MSATPVDLKIHRPDGRLRKHEAKKALILQIEDGICASDAIRAMGFTVQTYEAWRREDRAWAEQVSQAIRLCKILKGTGQAKEKAVPVLTFQEFSLKYLRQQVFPHMQNVIDMIEGRPPGWLHPAMTFEPGERDLLVVNVPPEHAKTSTIAINYVTFSVVSNPNIRVLLVSKTQQMAMKMLLAVKDRLTGPNYGTVIEDYAPRGGFAGNSAKWTQDTIYLNPSIRDSGEKDPTIQALGLGSHIYGARADLIILDDCVDSANAHDYEKQMEWIQSQVLSRLSPNGTILLVGTRLASRDLYMEIQNPRLYPEETNPWTYLSMPAVLEYADEAEDWVTLWPKSNQPDVGDRKTAPDADGMYDRWSGVRLAAKRARMTPNLWARVFQQAQVTEDTVFDPEDVRGCTNGGRNAGLIPVGKAGNRRDGMSGLVVVAGLDPATTGFTAMVVIGLDLQNNRRYVLDVFNRAQCKPDEIREAIYRLTEKYGVVEWVVETNGFQGFLAADREVNQFLASRGAIVRPHHTGINKADPNFGVSAMAALFKNWREEHNLIELPSTNQSEGLKALVEQLCIWAPDPLLSRKRKSDVVMALWMAELACQRRLDMSASYLRKHQVNPFLTAWDRSRQSSVNITDIEVYERLVSM